MQVSVLYPLTFRQERQSSLIKLAPQVAAFIKGEAKEVSNEYFDSYNCEVALLCDKRIKPIA